ncbi:MAG: hypothetical protein ACRDOA_05480 [Streptosporangiaceae bacterium]
MADDGRRPLEALDPDVVVRSNGAEIPVRGAAAVARRALTFTQFAQVSLPALINGAVGVVNAAEGRPITLQVFTITDSKIIAIDLIDNPGRIAKASLAILDRWRSAGGQGYGLPTCPPRAARTPGPRIRHPEHRTSPR